MKYISFILLALSFYFTMGWPCFFIFSFFLFLLFLAFFRSEKVVSLFNILIFSTYLLNCHFMVKDLDVGSVHLFYGRVDGSTFRVELVDGKNTMSPFVLKFKNSSLRKGRYSCRFKVLKKIRTKRGSMIFISKLEKIESKEELSIKSWFSRRIFYLFGHSSPFYFFCRTVVLGAKEKGNRGALELFKKGNLIHLLALSGLHIGILSEAISYIFIYLELRKGVRIFAIAFLLSIYMKIALFTPSIFRAYIMGMIRVLSQYLDEKIDSEKSFYFTLAIAIMLYPYSVGSISFQMSYLATYIIIKIGRLRLGKLANLMLFNFGIFIALLPLQSYYFRKIYPLGPFISLLLLLPFSLLIYMIFFAIIFPVPYLDEAIAFLSYILFVYLIKVLELLTSFSFCVEI